MLQTNTSFVLSQNLSVGRTLASVGLDCGPLISYHAWFLLFSYPWGWRWSLITLTKNLRFHKDPPKIFALHFLLSQHTSLWSFPQLLFPHHQGFRDPSRLPTALLSFLISGPLSKPFLKIPLCLLYLLSAPLPTASCFAWISPPPPRASHNTSCVSSSFAASCMHW